MIVPFLLVLIFSVIAFLLAGPGWKYQKGWLEFSTRGSYSESTLRFYRTMYFVLGALGIALAGFVLALSLSAGTFLGGEGGR